MPRALPTPDDGLRIVSSNDESLVNVIHGTSIGTGDDEPVLVARVETKPTDMAGENADGETEHDQSEKEKKEVERLKGRWLSLLEREQRLELRLRELDGLPEQEATVRELENRVSVAAVEARLLELKVSSLQEENQRLNAQVSELDAVQAKLARDKEQLRALKARVQSEHEEVCREAAALREKVMKLEKNGEVRARALEEEATALQMANAGLEEDNLELALRLRDPRSRSAPPLPERTISRADQLAMRVAELEEQLWTVTTHRRKAERAAAEVLAILESQGFGRFSDAADSGSDDDDDTGGSKARGEAEDALSGSELAGGLSWKGRAAGYDSERRQPQQKGRQLRPRHSLSNGRSYFYLLSADSSPKYQPGQSCRKIKRKELMRLQTEGEEGKHNVLGSPEEDQERSDCTVCTDEQHDLDGEVSQDGQGSCGDGRVEDGGRYAMEYEQDGEMERVLEKQAELVGRYEAEENAQREWEKKFNESSDSTADDVHSDNKLSQIENTCEQRDKASQILDRGIVCKEATRSSDKQTFGISGPGECLLNGSVSEFPQNTPEESATEQCKVVESEHDFGQATTTLASIDSELQVSKDELVNKSYTEINKGGWNNFGRSAPSPQGSYDPNAGQNKGQGDENSDSGSSYHANAHSSGHYINTPSVESPLSDTSKSKVSEWSSSCFHNHTNSQMDTQQYQLSTDDIGGVLEALQRAKMSLREKLSMPSPPSQDMLALPAPEDRYTNDDSPINVTELPHCRSRQLSQEILALPASGNYLSGINLPRDDAKVPVGPAGLFRLPTDSFPQNEVCLTDGYRSRFSLTATSGHTSFSSNPANYIMSTLSLKNPYYDPRSSMLLSMPTAGGCSIPVSDFTIGNASFIPEIPRSGIDLRGVPSGDASMLFRYGGDYTF